MIYLNWILLNVVAWFSIALSDSAFSMGKLELGMMELFFGSMLFFACNYKFLKEWSSK